MKKILNVIFILFLTAGIYAQEGSKERRPDPKTFFLSAGYSFLDVNLEIISMSKHSVWDGQDLGTAELDQEEIDSLNAFVDYQDRFHGFDVSAGMVFLDKPASRWYFDGRVMIGLSNRTYAVVNTQTGTTDITIHSENFSPWFGMGFNIKYQFDPHWEICLSPQSLYAFGTTNEIDDILYPVVEFMEESRDNAFKLSYTWADLQGSYTFGRFTFAAGPGFYYVFNTNEYTILRDNPATGKTYQDIIHTRLRSEMIINGSFRFAWKISDHFLFKAGAGISRDYQVTAGITWNL